MVMAHSPCFPVGSHIPVIVGKCVGGGGGAGGGGVPCIVIREICVQL